MEASDAHGSALTNAVGLYGITVGLSFLPHPLDLLPCRDPTSADASIVMGDVPAWPERNLRSGPDFPFVVHDSLRFHVTDVADYLIENGQSIVVAPSDLHSPQMERLRLFLLGPALAALLYQRGYALLHGTAVDFDGLRVAILGEAGTGKSTLGAALVQRGADLVADDLIAVSPKLETHQAVPWIRLRVPAIQALGLEEAKFQPVRPGGKKFMMPVPFERPDVGKPFDHIFVVKTAAGVGVSIERLTRMEAATALSENLYKQSFPKLMGRQVPLFNLVTRLASSAKLSVLHRPHGRDTIVETITLIKRQLAQG